MCNLVMGEGAKLTSIEDPINGYDVHDFLQYSKEDVIILGDGKEEPVFMICDF